MKSKGGLAFVLIVAAGALWAGSASAADTRAEWVAQVEPVCQAALPAATAANGSVGRAEKNLVRQAKNGSVKSFVRALRRLARSVQNYAGIDDALTNQLAAIPPVPADAAAVSTWLQGRRNSTALANSGAQALLRFKVQIFFKRIDQANAAYNQAVAAVSGFGLNACLTA